MIKVCALVTDVAHLDITRKRVITANLQLHNDRGAVKYKKIKQKRTF